MTNVKSEKTRTIKVLYVYDAYSNYSDQDLFLVSTGIDDWEEVSQEDFDYLRDNLNKIFNNNKYHPVLLEKPVNSFQEVSASIKQAIENQKRKDEEYLTKKAEEKKGRAEKIIERKRKQFERLSKELGNIK